MLLKSGSIEFVPPEDLQLVMFPGHNLHLGKQRSKSMAWNPLYNKFYTMWKSVWNKTFEDLKSSAIAKPSDFLRHSFSSVLFAKAQIIGFEMSCFFDLSQQVYLEHPYLEIFPPSFIEELRKNQIHKVMSIEYLYVSPAYRTSLQRVSFKEILSCIAMKQMLTTEADAMIAMPRGDKKVTDMIYGRGAKPVVQDMSLHNVSVDLVYLHRNDFKEYLGKDEDDLIEKYWTNRVDLILDEGEKNEHKNQIHTRSSTRQKR